MQFKLVVLLVLNVSIYVSSHCLPSTTPNLSEDNCGMILGIPLAAQPSYCDQTISAKYILPVTNMGKHTCSEEEMVPMGMIPLKNFKFAMVPLKTYLQQFTLPSYIKLWLVNANQFK